MVTYQVQHLHTDQIFTRPEIYLHQPDRSSSKDRSWEAAQVDSDIESFHRTLPDYAETQLHALPALASALGLAHVFVKDESTRFGLPAFKILGASWAIHRVITEQLGLPLTSSVDDVRDAIEASRTRGSQLRLVTCSEGNWGRACARMAKYLALPATIYVPGFMSEYTRSLIRGEGARVVVLDGGSYDDSIAAVREDAQKTGALMVMDVSWDGYEQIPRWVTDGYRTMLLETDRQVASVTEGRRPNTLFVSVGVGSWAHAVVSHYKSLDVQNMIVAVEPNTAASLKESLHCKEPTPIKTGHTIMAGMNCGTVSKIAWPVLEAGVHAAVTVDDGEAHQDVQYLKGEGVNAGPCGAATLAALRKFVRGIDERTKRETIVVLFSTEGWREYEIPRQPISNRSY